MACRICLEPDDLISVCACRGTQGFVHRDCVQRWIDMKGNDCCELCLAPYDSSLIRLPSPTTQTPERSPLFIAEITVGCLIDAVAAAAVTSPNITGVLMESMFFSLIIMYFWHCLFKINMKTSLAAIILWCGVFLAMSHIFRSTRGVSLTDINTYSMCIVVWAHVCCCGRNLYDMYHDSNRPQNEFHTEV